MRDSVARWWAAMATLGMLVLGLMVFGVISSPLVTSDESAADNQRLTAVEAQLDISVEGSYAQKTEGLWANWPALESRVTTLEGTVISGPNPLRGQVIALGQAVNGNMSVGQPGLNNRVTMLETRPLTMTVIAGGNSQIITYTPGTTQGLVIDLDKLGIAQPAGLGAQSTNTPAGDTLNFTGQVGTIKLIGPGGQQLAAEPFTGAMDFGAPANNPSCRDGEVIGTQQNDLQRTPIGLSENHTVMQVAWKGAGFGGFNRAVIIAPVIANDHQLFFVDGSTAVMTRHCGDLQTVAAYAAQSESYIKAMRQTAADGNGNIPAVGEVGVYLVDLNGHLIELVPSTTYNVVEITAHLEIVKLAAQP